MRFQLRNAQGTAVDPVPFIVTSLVAFLVTHAWGPLYLGALGVPLVPSLLILTALWVVIVAIAFRQLVWRYRPEHRAHVPTELRFRKFIYAIIIGCLLLLLLWLPFVR